MTYLLLFFFLFNSSNTSLAAEVSTNSFQWIAAEASSDTIAPEQYDLLFNPYYFSKERVAIKDGLWGMIDAKGEIVLPFEYEFLSDFERDSLCVFYKNGSWGKIHRNGEMILIDDFKTLFKYQNTYKKNNKYVCISGKCGVINDAGKIVIPLIYSGMLKFNNGVSTARLVDKCGVIDEANEVIHPFEYESIFDFDKEGKSFVVRQNGKTGTMLLDGTLIIPMQYDFIQPHYLHSKYWFVEKNRKKGIIDREGNLIVPLIYDELYTGKTIIVKKDGKSSVIHPDGQVIIPFIKGSLSRYNQKKQIYFLEKEGQYGLIDSLGKEIIPSLYDQISDYSFNYIHIKKDGKFGLLDPDYKMFIPPTYDKIELMWIQNHPGMWEDEDPFSVINGPYKSKRPQFLIALKNETIDIFDHKGEKQFTLNNVNPQISAQYLYSSERFLFYVSDQNSKVKIIDDTGKEILAAIYDQLSIFQDSLIKIESEKKYGLANIKGEIILSPEYDFIDRRIVGKNGKKGFLKEDYASTYGGLIFDDIKYQKNNELLFQKDSLWGICKLSDVSKILSKPFLPNQYQEIKKIGRGYMAKKENQWLLFDSKGKSQFDIAFDTIIENIKKNGFINLQKNNKWALHKFDSWENYKKPQFIYDEIDGHTVRVGKKWGTVHAKWQTSIPIIYDEIKSIGFYKFLVRKGKRWGCIDIYNLQYSPIQYDSIGWSDTEMIEVFKNKKAGIIDYDGNVLIPFQYHHIQANRNGQFLFTTKEKKSGILNAQGQEIIPPLYASIREAPTQYYKVTNDDKNGIIDTFGRIIIPCTLGDFYLQSNGEDIFADNRLLRIEDSKYGFVNRYNEVVIPYQMNHLGVFKDGVALVHGHKSQYFIDTLGNIISDKYDKITPFQNYSKPFYKAEKNGKTAVITPRKKIIPLEYDDLHQSLFIPSHSRSPIFTLKKDGKFGAVNHNNEVIYPFIFDQPITNIQNGLIQTSLVNVNKKNNRFYDGAGHLILSDTTINLVNPSLIINAFTVFSKNKKQGIINLKSQELSIPPIYKYLNLQKLCDGSIRIIANKGTYQGVLDIDGNIILPIEYESLRFHKEHSLVVGRKNGKWSWFDVNGNKKSNSFYDQLGIIGNRVIVEIQEKTGVIDLLTQQIILPFEYDVIQCFSSRTNNSYLCDKKEEKETYLYNVKQNGTWFTINEQGEKQNQFGEIRLEWTSKTGFYKFKTRGKYGLKNKHGKTILAPKFTSINFDPAGFISVTLKNSYTQGFYHLKEDRFYKFPYSVYSFSERNIPYRRIRKDGKMGLINIDLKWSIKPQYESMSPFAEGLYAVEKNGKTGFVNPEGKVIIPFNYGLDFSNTKETMFQNGFVILHKKQKYGIINKENKTIIPFEYDAILFLDNKSYLGRKNGKWVTLSL